jgi:hypothetical protein
MTEPTRQQLEQAVEALVPFVKEWHLSLNPEDLELMASVVLMYGNGTYSSEEIARGVEAQLAWVKEQKSRMYEEWLGKPRAEPPRPWPADEA